MGSVLRLADVRLQRQSKPAQISEFAPLPAVAHGETYLGARIPMRWLHAAGQLRGKALLLGVLLWHWATMSRRGAAVRVRPSAARAAGLSRNTMYRQLESLEEAGLILVTRRPGRAAEVVILDTP